MAKAQFHKNQRVFVRPVGTWSHVEAIYPQWVSGIEEPVGIYYDVGMGREFGAEELDADDGSQSLVGTVDDNWRIMRGQNKWRSAEECRHHPHPGTHPVVVTSEREWGGWRVPGSEYDRDPYMIERQARLIVNAPNLLAMMSRLIGIANEGDEQMPVGVRNIVEQARTLVDEIEAV